MTDESIGIVGAIGLTFLLFILRYLILPSGSANKRRDITPMTHLGNHKLDKTTVQNDAWLFWVPDLETDVLVDRGQSNEPDGERRKGPRYDQRREDRTIGGEIT